MFEEPTAPTGKTISQIEMKKCEIELKKHCDKAEKCDENKAKVFVIVEGQCMLAMKNKVESVQKHEEWESDNDAVNSSKGLKDLSHSAVEARHKHWTLCETMRKLYTEGQHKCEGVTGCCEHFKKNIDVVEELWGPLSPMGSATGGVTETEA